MNYIYGQLNQKIVKVEYEGVATDTSITNVDNKDCSISVDVRSLPHSLLINDAGREVSYNGSSDVAFSLHNYTVSKVEDAGEGNVAAYELKKDGVKIGDTIEIPVQSPISSIRYDAVNNELVFVLDDGTEVEVDATPIILSCEGSEYIQVDKTEGSNVYTISLKLDELKSELDISGIEGDIDSLQDRVDILERDIATKQDALEAGANISISEGIISAVDTTYTAGNGLSLDGTQFSVDTNTIATKVDVGAKQDTLSQAQLDAVNSGITTAKREGYDATVTTVGTITTTTLPTINNSITSLGNQIDEVKNDLDAVEGDLEDEVSDRQDADDILSGRIDDAEIAIAGKQDTLTAGANITIESNEISATDTTYTAGTGLDLTGTEFSIDDTVIATKQDLEGKQDSLTQEQLDAVNSGITADVLSGIQGDIAGKQDTLTFDSAPTEDSTNPVTSGGVFTALESKQDTLTAGEGITIEGNEISAEGKEYFAGTGLSLTGVDEDTFAVDTDVIATKEDLSGKQDTLDAGDNIIISGNEISAIDTTYEAGFGIKIADDSDEDEVSAISIDEGIVATKLELEGKQDVLTAGDNITIEDGVISSSGKIYNAGYGLELTGENEDTFQVDIDRIATQSDLSAMGDNLDALSDVVAGKQDALTEEQLAELDSGITEEKVAEYDAHISDTVIHCTQEEKDVWNSNHLAPEGELNIEFNADVPSTAETAPLQNILVGNKNYKIYDSGDSSGGTGSGDSIIAKTTLSPNSMTYAQAGGLYSVNYTPDQIAYLVKDDVIKYLYFNTKVSPAIERVDFKGLPYAPLVRFISDDNYEWREVYAYDHQPENPKSGELWLDVQNVYDETNEVWNVVKTLKKYYGDVWSLVEFYTTLPENPTVGEYYVSNNNNRVFLYTNVYRGLYGSAMSDWNMATANVAFAKKDPDHPDEYKYYLLDGVIHYYRDGAWVATHYVLDNSNPVEGQHYLTAYNNSETKYILRKYENGEWITLFTNYEINILNEEPNTSGVYMDYDENTTIVRYYGNGSGNLILNSDSGVVDSDYYFVKVIPFDTGTTPPENPNHLWWKVDGSYAGIKVKGSLYLISYGAVDMNNEDISIAECVTSRIINSHGNEDIVEVPLYCTPMGTIGLFAGWYFDSLDLNAIDVGSEPYTVVIDSDYSFRVLDIPQNVFVDSCIYEAYVPAKMLDLMYVTKGGNMKKSPPKVYGVYTYTMLLELYRMMGMWFSTDSTNYTIQTSDWVAASSDYSPFAYTYTTTVLFSGQPKELDSLSKIEIAPNQAVLLARTGIAILDTFVEGGTDYSKVVFGVTSLPSSDITVTVSNYQYMPDFIGFDF